MKGISKALVVAMLVFISLVPVMAFEPVLPTDSDGNSLIEQIGLGLTEGQVTVDSGQYSYARIAVTSDDDAQLLPQDAYSGLVFGAKWDNAQGYTAADVANRMQTAVTGAEGITRQYIAQTGSATITVKPEAVFDDQNKCVVPVATISVKDSNMAYVSGYLDKFTITPQSFAVAGGNGLDPVNTASGGPTECGNIWLYQIDKGTKGIGTTPTYTPSTISIEAVNANTNNPASKIEEAYAGTLCKASLTVIPEWPGSVPVPADVLVSGYNERFAGFIDAELEAGDCIDTTYAADTVSTFWNAASGVDYQVPELGDFGPNDVKWPDFV